MHRKIRRERAGEDDEDCGFCSDSKDMVTQMQGNVVATAPQSEKPAPPTAEVIGQSTWTFLHVMAAAYPESPDEKTQRDAFSLLKALGSVYPCKWCRDDWKEQIIEHPPAVGSRHDLEQWMCNRHNHVNAKLGKETFDCAKVHERWAKQ
jgi:mitochondrial FAD-linked sulfhydryl oxidase